jgi:hypothetical protein
MPGLLSSGTDQSSYGYFRLLYFVILQKANNIFANRAFINFSMTLFHDLVFLATKL